MEYKCLEIGLIISGILDKLSLSELLKLFIQIIHVNLDTFKFVNALTPKKKKVTFWDCALTRMERVQRNM